jgi:PAS domain S-box-containing protein
MRAHVMIRRSVAAALILWTISTLHSYAGTPAALDTVVLQLKWYHQFQFAGYYAAVEKGFYTNEGLHVILREGSPQRFPLQTVLDGTAEYGIADSDLLLSYLQGNPVVALGAIFQHSPDAFFTLQPMKLSDPRDFIGKRVMLIHDQGQSQLRALFQMRGLPFDSVMLVPHTFNFNDFLSGKVDILSGYTSNELFQLRQRGIRVNIFSPANYGIDFYADILFTTRNEVTWHPDRVEAFRRASFRGWDYAMSHIEEMISYIMAMPGNRPENTHDKLLFEAQEMRRLILPDVIEIGHMDPARWERNAEAYAILGSIRKPFDLTNFILPPPNARSGYWLEWTLGIIAVLLLAGAIIVMWIRQLRRLVAVRTSDLQKNNEQLIAETMERTLAQKKLSTLLTIADKLIIAKSFNEIGKVIFSSLSEYDPEGKRGGKLSVYYDDQDLFRIEFLEHLSTVLPPTNTESTLAGVKYFSNLAIEKKGTLIVDDTHGTFALVIDPTLIREVRSTLIFIPLYHQSAFVGLFSYSHNEAHSLDEQYVNLLESIAKYASIAIGELLGMRKKELAEHALAVSERKYRTLFDESQDMVFEANLDGSIIDINPAGVSILGYGSKEELLRLNIGEGLFADPASRESVISSLKQNGYVKDFEIKMRKKDGSVVILEETSTVVRNADGSVESYRGIARDITRQKVLEEQLLHAQKMESLGTLAGGIAHEFNNVLAMILPSAEMIAASTDIKSKVTVYVSRIIEAANRGASIAKQLLVFARSEKGEFKPVSLQRIVLEVSSLLNHTISKDITIHTEIAAQNSMILGENGLLHQAALNLALNAKDAMPDGGILTISLLDAPSEEVRRLFPDSERGPYLILRVTDTGVGMDEKTRNRMFDPFFTTKEPGRGTGLGLSIVHGIVINHRGYINVDSTAGSGTSVSIYIPRLQAEASVAVEPAERAAAGGTETILVIDDEEAIRDMLVDLLTTYGYSVLTARNGVEGLEMLQKHHSEIGVVLSDLGMPQMNGEQFFTAAKNFDPLVKIVISTGYLNPHIKSKLLGLGVHDVVAKPFSTEMLLPTLRRALDQG